MTEVWDRRISKMTQWNGDPQEAPDRCEPCDGTGRVYKIPRMYLTLTDSKCQPLINQEDGKPIAILSTDHLPDDVECSPCQGYGLIYSE